MSGKTASVKRKKSKPTRIQKKPIETLTELRQEIAFLNSIIENIPNMIFLKDAKELRFVRFNKAGQKLLGYAQKDLLGKNDYDFFPKEEADFFTKKDREVLRNRDVIDIAEEPVQTRKKGLRILHTKKSALYDLKGRPAYLLGISEDITDKKTAELKLDESEKRLRLALNASGIGTWSWDIRANQLAWDENTFRLFGVSPKTFKPKYENFLSIVVENERSHVEKTIQVALASSHEYNNEYTVQLPNDRTRRIAVRSMINRNDLKEAISMTGIAWDITEHQQKHALKIKSEMISMVSHELRTPIHTIKESMSVILEGLTGAINDEQRDILNTAKQCIDRLTRLVNNVLDFQKMEAGIVDLEFEKKDLNELTRGVAEIEMPAAKKKGLDLELLFCDAPLIAEVDSDKIIQVLTNIIHNAVKFTTQGTITIKTQNQPKEVLISIQDTGIGFSQEEAKKIFIEFGQTQAARKIFPQGTGLGLAVSKKIIEQHCGKIWAESRKGLGCIFYILLPKSHG